ncbi:MAG: hypothetical protein ABR597_14915 [Bacteroidales bacterium]
MKYLRLLFLAPLLMAFQCESDDEPVFMTDYFIQNNSSFDLILFTEEAGEIIIESQTRQRIATATSLNSFIVPSENIAFSNITLNRVDSSGNISVVYEQNPIVDELWTENTLSTYDNEYNLIITDESLN